MVWPPDGTNSEMTSLAYLTRIDHSNVFFSSLHEHLSRGEPSASLAFLLLVLRSRCSLCLAPERYEHLVLGAVYFMPPSDTNINSVRRYTRDLIPSLCVGATVQSMSCPRAMPTINGISYVRPVGVAVTVGPSGGWKLIRRIKIYVFKLN